MEVVTSQEDVTVQEVPPLEPEKQEDQWVANEQREEAALMAGGLENLLRFCDLITAADLSSNEGMNVA